MNIDVLSEIGLTQAEIKIYLSLLKIGESTSGAIIEDTSLQSSVFHRVVKHLISKGLVTYITKGKNRHYQALNPQSLVDYVAMKKNEVEKLAKDLEKLSNPSQENSAEMFVGKQAVFRALLSILNGLEKGDEYLSFSLIQPHDDEDIIRFYQQYNNKRREQGLNVKVLVHKSVKPIYEKHYTKLLLKKAGVRYTSFKHPQGLVITKNNVSFINWEDNPTAVKIENKKMAQQYKEFFDGFYNKEKDAY
jgi:sugar-specific transcriptional regulator TrmB